MLARGIRCTLLAASIESPHDYKPLPIIKCGDENTYALIPGECHLALRCHNVSESMVSVRIDVDGAKAVRSGNVLKPGRSKDFSKWDGGLVPIAVGPVLGTDSREAVLSTDLACITVRVYKLKKSGAKTSQKRIYTAPLRGSQPCLIPEGKKALEFGFASVIPVAGTRTRISTCSKVGSPVTITWHLRDAAGIDLVRERNGLPPLAARHGEYVDASEESSSASRGSRGRSRRAAAPSAGLAGKRRAESALTPAVIDLTSEDGGGRVDTLHGPTEPTEIDLTGGIASVTRLVRIKVCANDGAFMLHDTLVPDPEDAGGDDDVFDSHGRDSFVCTLLGLASSTLWPAPPGGHATRAERLWNLAGVPVLTRAEAIAAGTLVVSCSAVESFKKAATL